MVCFCACWTLFKSVHANLKVWDFGVSRMCYQMISDELTTTPLETETAQNHFSTKAERKLLVTNATECLSVMCVFCVFVCVSVLLCVCVYNC